MRFDFDLLVIGAGSGGVRAARMAAAKGARVAIAEARFLGGTCVNVGCIPKKLFNYAAGYRHEFEDAAPFGWNARVDSFEWDALKSNTRREVARLNSVYLALLQGSGVRILEGWARVAGRHEVEVQGKRYISRYILVATGGEPFVPEFPGRELVITSDQIFDLPEFPRRLLVVGGGYIAVELASIFAKLGAETSLSYRGQLPLRGFDKEVREFFARQLAASVDLRLNSSVRSVIKAPSGALTVEFLGGGKIDADCVLFATGRRPMTSGMGLEGTRVQKGPRGEIVVDSVFRTAEPSIYALGDVIGRCELTPVALAEGMAFTRMLLGGEKEEVDYTLVPTAVFSYPCIATVGLSEEEARVRYAQVVIFKSSFKGLKHTISGRDERNFIKVVVDAASDRVLGIHYVGENAAEIVQGFAVALSCGLTKAQLDSTLGIHPTAAEELLTLRISHA